MNELKYWIYKQIYTNNKHATTNKTDLKTQKTSGKKYEFGLVFISIVDRCNRINHGI